MLKALRALCKYFSPRSKNMFLSSEVTKSRDKLLENCKYAISLLEVSEHKVTLASNQKETTTTSTTSTAGDENTVSISEGEISYEITDREIIKSFMILTHGALIQEWEHFLYDIFVEGIIAYLIGYDLAAPKHKLSLKNMKQTAEIEEMRKNISEEVRVSLKGYEDLFRKTCQIFKVAEPKLSEEMQKQIQIRHIFQHNRGIIRRIDLKEIGRENGAFEILNNKGLSESYGEGQEIPLSQPEIQKLYDIINEYSNKFKITSDMTQLVK